MRVWRRTGYAFVECPLIWICLIISSWFTWCSGIWENYSGEILFSSHYIGVHDITWFITGVVNLNHLIISIYARFFHCKFPFFPLIYSVLLKWVTKSSLHTGDGKLSSISWGERVYPHILFEILLWGNLFLLHLFII